MVRHASVRIFPRKTVSMIKYYIDVKALLASLNKQVQLPKISIGYYGKKSHNAIRQPK